MLLLCPCVCIAHSDTDTDPQTRLSENSWTGCYTKIVLFMKTNCVFRLLAQLWAPLLLQAIAMLLLETGRIIERSVNNNISFPTLNCAVCWGYILYIFSPAVYFPISIMPQPLFFPFKFTVARSPTTCSFPWRNNRKGSWQWNPNPHNEHSESNYHITITDFNWLSYLNAPCPSPVIYSLPTRDTWKTNKWLLLLLWVCWKEF